MRVVPAYIVAGFSAVLASTVLMAPSAQASLITVGNGSFETNENQGLGNGGNTGAGFWHALAVPATDIWTCANSSPYMVFGVSPSSYAHFHNAANGTWLAYLVNCGTITQTLSYTVAAGDTFTLDFYVAKGLQSNAPGDGTLTASILVGGSPIATDATFASTAAAGSWDHKTLTGTATGTGALSISFAPGASSPWLDNVTMSVAVPEPATMGLLALGASALLSRRMRKQK